MVHTQASRHRWRRLATVTAVATTAVALVAAPATASDTDETPSGPSVVIEGDAAPGVTLKAVTAGFSPETDRVEFQWLQSTEASDFDYVDVPGATDSTLKLGREDAETGVEVRVTGFAGDVETGSAVSDSVWVGEMVAGVVDLDSPDGLSVGATVSASPQGFTPEADAYRFQWLRSGQPIAGATSQSYTLTADDAQHDLSVEVVGQVGGLDFDAVDSTPSCVPPVGQSWCPTTEGAVEVTGLVDGGAPLGATLTASTSGVVPDDAQAEIKWYREEGRYGFVEIGAGASYVPTVADAGSSIFAGALLTRDGYQSSSPESTHVLVTGASIGSVSVTGKVEVGQTLTAALDGFTPAPDADQTSFEWFRNGASVSTDPTYEVTSADVGADLWVTAVAAYGGASFPKVTSARVSVPSDVAVSGGWVTLDKAEDNNNNNEPLVASWGGFDPAPSAIEVSWQRDGKTVETSFVSATDTQAEYWATSDDADDDVTVTITAWADGHSSQSVTSDPVHIAPDWPGSVPGTVGVEGTPQVGETLTGVTDGWDPVPDEVRFQWLRDGEPIDGATSATYVVADADAGHAISVQAEGFLGGIQLGKRRSEGVSIEAPPAG